MDKAQGWDRRRYATLALVFGLHVALLVALLRSSPGESSGGSSPRPLELLSLPPVPASPIRPDNFRPHRIGVDLAVSIAPPVPGALSMAPSTSGSEGSGSGVDWRAEARRALLAFEIRNGKRSNDPSPTNSSAEESWWPQGQHHAGEQYKTDTGDWIVWIDASCYQVARAASSYTPGAVLPPTVCLDKDARPRGDRFKDKPAYKKSRPGG